MGGTCGSRWRSTGVLRAGGVTGVALVVGTGAAPAPAVAVTDEVAAGAAVSAGGAAAAAAPAARTGRTAEVAVSRGRGPGVRGRKNAVGPSLETEKSRGAAANQDPNLGLGVGETKKQET